MLIKTTPTKHKDLNGIDCDTEDDQNQIVILNGEYSIEHEHLTEHGNVAVTGNPGEFLLTIEEGDAEGASQDEVNAESSGPKRTTTWAHEEYPVGRRVFFPKVTQDTLLWR